MPMSRACRRRSTIGWDDDGDTFVYFDSTARGITIEAIEEPQLPWLEVLRLYRWLGRRLRDYQVIPTLRAPIAEQPQRERVVQIE